jgi:hypothetical protein
MEMTPGERLTLQAMKNDLKRLSQIAQKAKESCDEVLGIGSELLAIHKEFLALVDAGEPSEDQLVKLDELKHRRERANKIMKKDWIKLSDRQFKAESDRDNLAREIENLEFRLSLRKSG